MAAVSTLVEASFEALTAPSARCEACSDDSNSPTAVDCMACALLLTLFSTLSTRSRNPAIASSITVRRLSSSFSEDRWISAIRCSVMSSWVATQPPSPIGRLTMEMKRPSCSRTLATVLPFRMLLSRSAMYWSGLPEKLPAAIRCSMMLRSDVPGRAAFGSSPYIWVYRTLHRISRAWASHMHKPCDMLLSAVVHRFWVSRWWST